MAGEATYIDPDSGRPIVVNVTAPKVHVAPARVTVNLPEPKPVRRTIEFDLDADGDPVGATITGD